GRGVKCVDESDGEGATVDRAARVAGAGLGLADVLLRHVGADLGAGDERGARLLQNRSRVADVVAMAMRQKNVRDAFRRAFPSALPGWVPAQERVNENDSPFYLDTKRRMTIPGNFHQSVPLACFVVAR